MYLFCPYREMAHMDLRASLFQGVRKLGEAAAADGFEHQLRWSVKGERDPDSGERE